MNVAALMLQTLERAIGRRRLWRMARLAYTYARRDFPESEAIRSEKRLMALLSSAHAPDRAWTALDVGAFIGRWSVALLAVRPDTRLFAFEPTPASRTKLIETLAGRGEVVAMAVSDHVGSASFLIHGEEDGVNRNGVNRLSLEGSGQAVSLTTLDVFCAEQNLTEIDIVKIDAEGHDLAVLRGASGLIHGGQVGVIQFEYNHHWLTTHSALKDVFDLVADTPYTVGKIVQDGVELYNAWHPEMERFFQADYALVRNDLAPMIGRRGSFDIANTYA